VHFQFLANNLDFTQLIAADGNTRRLSGARSVLDNDKAEWLGNNNRKTMIKVKTTGQILPFKKRHGFAQSISSAWL
jgi:hypothetical protein